MIAKGATRVNGPRSEETMQFRYGREAVDVREVLTFVYRALEQKGYDPVSQLVGYLLSGDPTYITNHAGARTVIRSVDRDLLLEELVKAYIDPSAASKAGGA